MDLKLKNKKILITGASKGLGFACAKSLAQEGAHVILNSRNLENLQAAKKAIDSISETTVEILPADVSTPEGVDIIINHIKHAFPKGIDGLVLNAGGPPAGRALTKTREDWLQAIQTNFLAGVKLCKGIVPQMVENGYGRVVAITSTSVKKPMLNLVLSNSVRLGLIGYLRTLANEVGPYNVLVNVVCPGPTNTERLDSLLKTISETKKISLEKEIASRTAEIPLGRFGEPHELGDFVAYLISARNTYITGQVTAIDGGQTNMIF